LADPEWGKWPDREIAKRCWVSDFLRRTVKQEMRAAKKQQQRRASAQKTQMPDTPELYREQVITVHRGEQVYQMNTAELVSEENRPHHLSQMRR
jgi:hypothetical protein